MSKSLRKQPDYFAARVKSERRDGKTPPLPGLLPALALAALANFRRAAFAIVAIGPAVAAADRHPDARAEWPHGHTGAGRIGRALAGIRFAPQAVSASRAPAAAGLPQLRGLREGRAAKRRRQKACKKNRPHGFPPIPQAERTWPRKMPCERNASARSSHAYSFSVVKNRGYPLALPSSVASFAFVSATSRV